ncbi:hypothetical protein [Sphingobium sp. CECT 9361]|uniref:hypothetical protein n=1 Tax=Sphingobium sp. CECT 9361 TaxID=2845384 RepID=UPI001E5CB988|nr:hypothetical protein [Sphingobium sp. CECT 9361]CAH0356820.1 hypothetical protein SPH9361_04463 [Sphingobium sp. CECT 9361]
MAAIPGSFFETCQSALGGQADLAQPTIFSRSVGRFQLLIADRQLFDLRLSLRLASPVLVYWSHN